MIDMRRLQVLRAVAHYGTVTAAARALHFTPSAASQQLRKLGRDLGVELVEPVGRGVRLTAAARALLAHADEIAARWEQAENELRTLGDQPVGPVRVSGFPTAVASLFAPMAAALRRRAPELTVEIRQTELRDSFDLLFSGEVDLAVVEAVPGNPTPRDARFEQHFLLDDPFDLLVPEDHPLAGRRGVPLAETADEQWIAPLPESSCHAHTVSACGAAGFTPSVAHHATDWHAVAHLVAHRLGVALVPRLAALPPQSPIRRVPCAGNPRRRLLTCTRAGGHAQPAVAVALEELRRTAVATVAEPAAPAAAPAARDAQPVPAGRA